MSHPDIALRGPIGIERTSPRQSTHPSAPRHQTQDTTLGTWQQAVVVLVGPRLPRDDPRRQRDHARLLASAALDLSGDTELAAQVRALL